MITDIQLPEWLTEEETERAIEIVDRIVGEGEESGAPDCRINQEVKRALKRYIETIKRH